MRSTTTLSAALVFVTASAGAQVPDILLEACSLFDSQSKRMECLRAANRQGSAANAPAARASPQSLMAAPTYAAPTQRHMAPSPSLGSSGSTCYVGPRGGTYTITKSGRKNYGGC